MVLKRISKPQINRTSLIDYNFTNTNIEKPHEHNNCVLKLEKIPKSHIKQEIKNIKNKYNNVVSTNDLLSAKVFKRTFDIQQAYKSNKFSLAIPMDVRRQVKELGLKYFGNGLLLHSLKLNVSELEKINTDELAIKLRESIPVIDSKSYLEYLTKLETQIKNSAVHSLKPYNPETGCLVTNLSRIPIHKLDYGKGSPKLVLPLTIGKNSAAILSDKQNYILRLAY
ncbi:acyltransferase [Candidatus Neomarinimicrobiota bacterium]